MPGKALIICSEDRSQARTISLLETAFPGIQILMVQRSKKWQALIAAAQVDLILVGSADPTSLNLVQLIQQLHPATEIIVAIDSSQRPMVGRALQAGAVGYLSMNDTASELIARLRSLTRKDTSISAQGNAAFANLRKTPDGDYIALTHRQRHILRLIASGHSTRSIAEQLGISFNTADTHIRRLYSKLSIRTRVEAAHAVHQLGLGDNSAFPQRPK